MICTFSRTGSFARSILMGACLLGVMFASRAAYADDPPGKAVFVAAGCPQCHSVTEQGIKSDGDAGDLSKVGAKHDAATIEKFITKQAELNGKKHKKKYQGSDDDLKKLVAWLASLK